MKTIMRITLFNILLFSLAISTAYSAAEQRTALVIGNGSYSTGSLRNPVNDADDMAASLKRLGFDVILKKNTSQQDMEEAIRNFGDRLKRGGVGLFFYAGHGVQISGKNFLLPIGVKIDRETDVKYRAVDADMVLDEMGNAGNPMNIVILDACRDNPFGKTFRTASRGLAIISSAPRGTLISYSTNPGNVAADGSGRNSPYTGSLMKHMMTPGLPIEEVFKNVRQDIGRATGGKQIPWELSSLEGRFYFNDRAGGGGDLAIESKRLDDERQRIAQERELLEKQKALDEEREKLEALKREQAKPSPPAVQKKEVAIVTPPTVAVPKEVKKDDRLIACDNGTVLDTKTNLMWAAKDNGNNINWANAKSYCENYRGEGYTNWRMPTQNELEGLYTSGAHKDKIKITSWVWASETHDSAAAHFHFDLGQRNWGQQSDGRDERALPVRLVDEAEKLQMVKTLTLATPSSKPTPRETARDGRFIAYDDGTVLDTKTNLMWAAKDNGRDINRSDAKFYCENYGGGSYTNWRMPTHDELAGLYNAGEQSYKSDCGYEVWLPELIRLSCTWAWASEVSGSDNAFFFGSGMRFWGRLVGSTRALPVRSAK